jgi:hypothetical protein
MTFGSRRLKIFVISAAVTLALLILTSMANASLVLADQQKADQPYQVAETTPQTRQSDLQPQARQETTTAPVENAAKPDVKADKKASTDREDRVKRAHRRLHKFSGRLRGWLHRWRIGVRW